MNKNELYRSVGVAALSAIASTLIVLSVLAPKREISETAAASNNTPKAHAETLHLQSDEERVVGVVDKANPAVVAITISRKMPVYKQELRNVDPFGGGDPFGGLFGGLGFQVPVQRQIGSEMRDVGGGSGFLVSSDGYIVTNKHVVSSSDDEYTVMTSDGEKHDAKVIARDPVLDLAVVKIEKKNRDFPYLSFADSENVKLGQSVIVIGNALAEFRNTVSMGIVSGLGRTIIASDRTSGVSEKLDQLMQTDAAINPGNSGGPLLNSSGQVLGVAVATAGGASNVSFAILGNSAKAVVHSVMKTGKISRPYLGVRYVGIDREVSKKNNLDYDYGVLVQRGEGKGEFAVAPGSPADKSGILENDIILELDGKKIAETNPLGAMIRTRSVGEQITLKIVRKGKETNILVTLGEYKEN